jgi:glutaredoxin
MTEVLVLTAEGCHWCADAEAMLARLAQEFDLHVTAQPAETDEGRALVMANGALFPPVLFVNGVFAQYGRPSERKLRAVLRAVGAQAPQEAR